MLHKNGIDPDFNYTKKFDVEVDPLIGTFDLRRKRVGCVADSGHGAGGLGGGGGHLRVQHCDPNFHCTFVISVFVSGKRRGVETV